MDDKEKRIEKSLYQEHCLVDSYRYAIEPIKDQLVKVIDHYYDRYKNIYHEVLSTPFVYQLLPVTRYMRDELPYEDIDKVIDFVFLINLTGREFGTQLNAILFPNQTYELDKKEFSYTFYRMFFEYESRSIQSKTNDAVNTKIHELFNIYMDAVKELATKNSQSSLIRIKDITQAIFIKFYLTNGETYELKRIFDNIINQDFNSILTHIDLNKLSDLDYADYLINNNFNNQKIIK